MKLMMTRAIVLLGGLVFLAILAIAVTVPTEAFSVQTELDSEAYIPFFLEGLSNEETAPHFVSEDTAGNIFNSDDLVGKAYYIKFWSPECEYCRAELPAVTALYETLKDDYVFITVVSGLPANEVKKFVDENALPFMVLVDENTAIKDKFSVKAIPYGYYVNDQGLIEKSVIGAQTCSSEESDSCIIGE